MPDSSAGGSAAPPLPSSAIAGTAAPCDTAASTRIPGEAVAGNAGTTSSLEEVERETILRTLTGTAGNKSEAARRLGITRRTLHQKLRRYGMM
jgi:two-component system response regulator HydG